MVAVDLEELEDFFFVQWLSVTMLRLLQSMTHFLMLIMRTIFLNTIQFMENSKEQLLFKTECLLSIKRKLNFLLKKTQRSFHGGKRVRNMLLTQQENSLHSKALNNISKAGQKKLLCLLRGKICQCLFMGLT